MQRVLDTLLAHDEAALMPGSGVEPDSIFALEQTSQVQWPRQRTQPGLRSLRVTSSRCLFLLS